MSTGPAEARILRATAPAATRPTVSRAELRPPPTNPDLAAPDIAIKLQAELRRVGCLAADPDGDWNAASVHALERYNKYSRSSLDTKLASLAALDAVRSRIMPMLYPHDVWQQRFPNFVGMPWVGGLVVLYVIDESHAYWYVRDDLIDRKSVV